MDCTIAAGTLNETQFCEASSTASNRRCRNIVQQHILSEGSLRYRTLCGITDAREDTPIASLASTEAKCLDGF
jgi:hypothetical protein